MRIKRESIEMVREATDIVEVASEFTALRKQGSRYNGLCPYPDHQEKTPSFSVDPDNGLYYCFGCLEANELIWTSEGLVPISATEVGDEVIGLDGRRERITDKWLKSGLTIRIETGAAKEGIELTPDHLCVFVKKSEALREVSTVHLRSSDGDEARFSAKLRREDGDPTISVGPASEVRPGDFWLYPVVPEGERTDTPLPGGRVIKPYTKGPRTERTTELHVNPDTAWLYGLWLAEGSLYRGGIRWSLGMHESSTLAARVVEIVRKEFGKSVTVFARSHKNICEVTCSSTDLAALFGHWFGRGCACKRVPTDALNWTAKCQMALVDGYLDGDGYRSSEVTTATTVSESLAYGIFSLCIQAGKICSVSYLPERVGKDGVNHRKTYSIHILHQESLRGFYAEVNGTCYFWSSVQAVERCDENKTVVDITTTGSHTFLTKMGLTHNCQKGGDAIKLVMDLENLPFTEAVSRLADQNGIQLQTEGKQYQETQQNHRQLYRCLAAAAAYYHKYLLNSNSEQAKSAKIYLKNRGFGESTIVDFRVGYAPSGGEGFLGVAGGLGFGRGMLGEAGLLSSGGGERFRGRVMFPISDRRGRVVGFGGRVLGEGQPKYLNSPESGIFSKRRLLYGLSRAMAAMRRERVAIVVEGYTDVLMLHQSGIENVVATLGTAITPEHLKTLSGHADRIHVLFDPDAAGEKAVQRAAVAASELKLDLRVLQLAEDPADWLLQHSAAEFNGALEKAEPILEYVIRRMAEDVRGAEATSRSRAVPEMKEFVGRIGDPVQHREAVRLAAEALGVGHGVFRQSESTGNYVGEKSSETFREPIKEAAEHLLSLMLLRPDLAEGILKNGLRLPPLGEALQLAEEDFGAGSEEAQIFYLFKDHAGEGLDAVLADERARPLMNRIGELSSRTEKVFPSQNSLQEAVLRLAVLSRQRRKNQSSDYDEKERLRSEIRTLEQALRNMPVEDT